MSTDESKDKARGFAGLADLAPPPPPSPPPSGPPIALNDQEPESSALRAQPETHGTPKKTKDANKALWITCAVAFAAILIYGANSANNAGSTPPAPSAPVDQPPASPAPAYAAPAPATESAPVQPPVYTPEPVVELLPPQGAGLVLNDSQIAYCVAQKMRLETWRNTTDVTNSADVDRFNAQISDYNSRCSSYRYQQGAQERVASELESERSRIESMARASWLATTPPAPTPAPTYVPDLSSHYNTPAPVYPPFVPAPSTSSDDSNNSDDNGNSGNDDNGNGNE